MQRNPPEGHTEARSEWQAETDPEKPSGRPASPEQKAVSGNWNLGQGALRRPGNGRARPLPRLPRPPPGAREHRAKPALGVSLTPFSVLCPARAVPSPREISDTHTQAEEHCQETKRLARPRQRRPPPSPRSLSLHCHCPQESRSHAAWADRARGRSPTGRGRAAHAAGPCHPRTDFSP